MNRKRYMSLDEAVTDIFGSGRRIVSRCSVSGGDINDAFRLMLDDGTAVFMKSNRRSALSHFSAEAKGLEKIRETKAIGVPLVLGLGTEDNCSFLLLEYISESRRIRNYWETFADQLAKMHRAEVSGKYGLSFNNWIGSRKQNNEYHDSWVSFFGECRLRPQFEAAGKYLSLYEQKKADLLITHLDCYLEEPERPSLVHGDLWAGNLITGNDGKGWLIDPAVYYGHPEVDIAMTELFGGFSLEFYKTCKELGMLSGGYEDRRDLYNLYQLLNHLNMFGESYLEPVLRILKRYTGK